jgi:hypothetical protein
MARSKRLFVYLIAPLVVVGIATVVLVGVSIIQRPISDSTPMKPTEYTHHAVSTESSYLAHRIEEMKCDKSICNSILFNVQRGPARVKVAKLDPIKLSRDERGVIRNCSGYEILFEIDALSRSYDCVNAIVDDLLDYQSTLVNSFTPRHGIIVENGDKLLYSIAISYDSGVAEICDSNGLLQRVRMATKSRDFVQRVLSNE